MADKREGNRMGFIKRKTNTRVQTQQLAEGMMGNLQPFFLIFSMLCLQTGNIRQT